MPIIGQMNDFLLQTSHIDLRIQAQIAQINERSAITETSDSWYGEGAHAWMSQGQSITWKKQQEKFDTECHAKCE